MYTPEAGAEWGGERAIRLREHAQPGSPPGARRGVDNDGGVITLTTFDDSRYASKNTAPSVEKPPAPEGDVEEADETKAYKPKVNTWGSFATG